MPDEHECSRVGWIQAMHALELFVGMEQVSGKQVRCPGQVRDQRRIRVERSGTPQGRETTFMVPADCKQDKARESHDDRILAAGSEGMSCQCHRCLPLRPIGARPRARKPLLVTPCGMRLRPGVSRVQRRRPLQ